MKKEAGNSRSTPSLDGLRALSVLAVILGHTQSALLDRIPFNALFRNASVGVVVFFVISGFLITHLLLKELRREKQIDLKRFYLRRSFRIFPPFYVFLLVIAIFRVLHKIPVGTGAMLVAGTYTWNYVSRSSDVWILGHCWSLALEEQFYLLWPACMAFFGKQKSLWIAGTVILLSPFSRLATYAAFPHLRGNIGMMLHTHLDGIMTGCLLALIVDMDLWPRFRNMALLPVAPVASILFLLFLDPAARSRWAGGYMLPIGVSLENLAIAVLLLYAVFRHQSPLGKFLNLGPLRHLGAISYSLYLWQQLFAGPYTRVFPLNIVFIIACAEASYFLVERPSFQVRDLVQRRFMEPRFVPVV